MHKELLQGRKVWFKCLLPEQSCLGRGHSLPSRSSTPGQLPGEATELTQQQELLLPAWELCGCLCLSGDLSRETTTLKPFREPQKVMNANAIRGYFYEC